MAIDENCNVIAREIAGTLASNAVTGTTGRPRYTVWYGSDHDKRATSASASASLVASSLQNASPQRDNEAQSAPDSVAWAVCLDCCVIPVVGPIYSTCPFSASPLLRFLVLLFIHYHISLAQLAAPWKSRCQDADWPSKTAQIFRDILLIVNQLADREPAQQGPVTNWGDTWADR